jgi:hypothetical protein
MIARALPWGLGCLVNCCSDGRADPDDAEDGAGDDADDGADEAADDRKRKSRHGTLLSFLGCSALGRRGSRSRCAYATVEKKAQLELDLMSLRPRLSPAEEHAQHRASGVARARVTLGALQAAGLLDSSAWCSDGERQAEGVKQRADLRGDAVHGAGDDAKHGHNETHENTSLSEGAPSCRSAGAAPSTQPTAASRD